jgi:hypothetical protein
VQDCGKDGVVAFRSTINRLNYLTYLAGKVSATPRSGNLVHGFYTYRVQRSWQEVGQYLQLTQTEADKIRRREADDKPILSAMNQPLSLDPTTPKPTWPPAGLKSGMPLDGVRISVNGQHIQPGAIMRLIAKHDPSQGFEGVTNANSLAPTPGNKGNSILSTFDLTTVPIGQLLVYTIVVINPDGQTAWLDDWLSVTVVNEAEEKEYLNQPVVKSVTPSSLRINSLKTKGATLIIAGEHLLGAATMLVGIAKGSTLVFAGLNPHAPAATDAGGSESTLVIISNTRAELTLPPNKIKPPLSVGSYDITVISSGGQTDTLPQSLVVRA